MAEARAFICGHPVAHSRSPLIHRHWLSELGLPGTYDPIDLPPDRAEAFFRALPASGYVGGNVTLPNKETAFAAVASRDEAAEAIGAVNTIWIEKGHAIGGNTDAHGFLANLDARAPGWDSRETALVLGAGGAARAVVYGLRRRGLTVLVANRTEARAIELAGALGARAIPWEDRNAACGAIDLMVNTTALGMEGHDAGALPIELDRLPDHALVTDIVYAPLITPILAAAAARGLAIVDGLGMLLHQAAPGFEHWFGLRPRVTEELRTLVTADLERRA
ncbi:MAG: shikimate dehydrogenase [Phyllobacteriaceae bacterium]|nr:shikimate dehydrogenase [Phyllobacteriaceae bacterium]